MPRPFAIEGEAVAVMSDLHHAAVEFAIAQAARCRVLPTAIGPGSR